MQRRARVLRSFPLMLCLLAAGCGDVAPGTPARIAFGETIFDAGRVQQGAKVEHVFAFRNAGERDLRISRVRSSCDCVAVADTDAVVPAGAPAEITASLDTAGLFGEVSRSIVVFTNDPSAPAVLLKLKVDIAFDAAANPRRLYVGHVQPGDEVRTQGRVVLGGGTEIAGVDAAGAVVAAGLVEPASGTAAQRERRFRIQIREQAPAGPFTDQVTVRTTSRTTPALTIPVSGVVEVKS